MDAAKIRLSAKEQELVFDAEWILTKNRILEKVKDLFEQVQNAYHLHLLKPNPVPPEVLQRNSKISRGENYKGLPWLVLDFPRYFGKEDMFAIRTMFWWGNFFSITLYLSGRYKQQFENKLVSSFGQLCSNDFFVCVNDDPWQHHFETNNYQPVESLSEEEFESTIRKQSFLKLAAKLSLQQWDNAAALLEEKFQELMKVIEG